MKMMTMIRTTTLPLALVVVAMVMTTMMTTALGFRRHNNQLLSNELLQSLRKVQRSGSPCLAAGNTCFSSIQCCLGFVCAAFDDYSGENPEVPGFCVKEKDLQLCETDSDCLGIRSVCLGYGHPRQRYCLTDSLRNEIDPLTNPSPPRKFSQAIFSPGTGRLGSSCETSSDCSPMTESNAPLCCKDVRRARQGVKRMCDKMETPSPCI